MYKLGDNSHLSHTLHRAANFSGHALKAVKIPAWNLGDNVVQTGLKAGSGLLRYSILDIWQRYSQSQLSSNKCQRVPGRQVQYQPMMDDRVATLQLITMSVPDKRKPKSAITEVL